MNVAMKEQAGRPHDGRTSRAEIAQLLAAAYLRLQQARAANRQPQAHLRPPDSSLLPCYEAPPEACIDVSKRYNPLP